MAYTGQSPLERVGVRQDRRVIRQGISKSQPCRPPGPVLVVDEPARAEGLAYEPGDRALVDVEVLGEIRLARLGEWEVLDRLHDPAHARPDGRADTRRDDRLQ